MKIENLFDTYDLLCLWVEGDTSGQVLSDQIADFLPILRVIQNIENNPLDCNRLRRIRDNNLPLKQIQDILTEELATLRIWSALVNPQAPKLRKVPRVIYRPWID